MTRNTPKRVSLPVADPKADTTPPAADARPGPITPATVPPLAVTGLVVLPPPRTGNPQRSTNNIFPEGPIGDVMRQHH